MRRPDCAGAPLLRLAGRRLRGRCGSRFFAFAPDPAAGTAAAATAAAAPILLLSVPWTGIGTVGGRCLFRIIGLVLRGSIACSVTGVVAGRRVPAVGALRFGRALALLIRGLARILIRMRLAVAVTALLVVRGMLLFVAAAGMTVAGHRGREPLVDVLHIDVGDRDFTAADSRALALIHGRDDAVVMVGMLEKVLRRHAVAHRAGISRELQILLKDLIRIAADPDVGAGAVV